LAASGVSCQKHTGMADCALLKPFGLNDLLTAVRDTLAH
jgi:hypothetical protein